MSLSHDAEAIDYKVTKRHYPRTNNQNCLEFVLEKDPNLFLRKNKILIKGAIECDKNYLPENGFAAKLFSMLTVEIEYAELAAWTSTESSKSKQRSFSTPISSTEF